MKSLTPLKYFSGDIEDFPGLSSLVKYEVVEDGGGIYLSLRSELTETTKKGPEDSGLDTKVVVVGGGAAGHTAIQTLRFIILRCATLCHFLQKGPVRYCHSKNLKMYNVPYVCKNN